MTYPGVGFIRIDNLFISQLILKDIQKSWIEILTVILNIQK